MKVYSINKYNCTKLEEKEVTRVTDASIFFIGHKGKEVSERVWLRSYLIFADGREQGHDPRPD